jgi:hypothetical protein
MKHLKIYRAYILVLIFLILVSLVMTVFFVGFSKKIMTNSALRHLDTVASLQELRLEEILERYRSQVELVQSRTNMRKQINLYNETGSLESLDVARNVIVDASKAVPMIKVISIYSLNGDLLISTETDPRDLRMNFDEKLDEIKLSIFNPVDGGSANIEFLAPLQWESKHVANIRIEISAEDLFAIAETYDGLSSTGETFIALKVSNKEFMTLTRLRYKENSLLEIESFEMVDKIHPIHQAIKGFEEIYVGAVFDYREHEVFAVTRYVEDFDQVWGLVVKIDIDDILKDFYRFRYMVIFTIFGSFASVVLLSGIYMTMTHRSLRLKKV